MKVERLAEVNLSLVEDKKTLRVSEADKKGVDKRKRKLGLLGYRNRKYDTTMCKRVVELMSEGKSTYVVAKELGVVTETLCRWEREHEEFAEAMHLGSEASRAWWEEQARENLIMSGNIKFNTQSWTFNMKNRFNWADSPMKDEKGTVGELLEKKGEIENRYDEEHTAEVLDILKGIGAIQSSAGEVVKAADDEVHKTGTDS